MGHHTYLHNRVQKVGIDGLISNPFDLCCGVPQGSCLGPILFIIYASKLCKIIDHELPSVHCYADDTQLYLSFKPNSTSQDQVLQAMENCIEKIRKRMIHDRMLINDSKTELILIGSKQQLAKLQPISISVGNSTINNSSAVKNLGCWFDANLSMYKHITNVCNSAIKFKIILFISKAVHNLAPSYINNLLTIKSKSSYCLRSNDGLYLEPAKGKMLKTFEARSFQAAAPYLWNRLLHEIRLIESLHKFKKAIKTFLFNEAVSNH